MEEKLTWQAVAWLMLSDIIGTSVLTFSGVANQLGLVPSVVFILGLFPLSLHSSALMCRTRSLLEAVAAAEHPGRPPPALGSMGAVAGCALGGGRGAGAVHAAVYGYQALGLASYLQVLGTSLQHMQPHSGVCLPRAVGVACALLVAPVFFVRSLGSTPKLCLVNTALIIVVVVVALADLAQHRDPATPGPEAFAPGLDIWSALGAMTNILFSFAGQWMYFEIMDTMAVPADFLRAFWVAGPLMLSTYLAVAIACLMFGGTASSLLDCMSGGAALQIANALLFLHVLVVYLVKSIVLAQFFHSLLWHDCSARTKESYLRFGSCGMVVLAFGYVVSNAVPFFDQLMGLIGGCLAGPINFVLPVVLFFSARKRASAVMERSGEGSPPHPAAAVYYAPPAARIPLATELGSFSVTSSDSGLTQIRRLSSLARWDMPFISTSVALTVLTMIFGVGDVLHQIIGLSGDLGGPFACHALRPQNSTS